MTYRDMAVSACKMAGEELIQRALEGVEVVRV